MLDMDTPTQTRESAKANKRQFDAYKMSIPEFEQLKRLMMFNGFNSSTNKFSLPGNFDPLFPYQLGDGEKVRKLLYFREADSSERDGSQGQYFADYVFDLEKALSRLKGLNSLKRAFMDQSSLEENRPERGTGPDRPRPVFRDTNRIPRRLEDDGFLWTRLMDSRTVQAYGQTISRNDLLKKRTSQIIGFLGKLGNIIGPRAETLVRIYIWQGLIFESVWTGLAEKFDKHPNVEELCKCLWRSDIVQRQMLVLAQYETGLYAIERIAYGQIASNEMKGMLTQVIDNVKKTMEAVPNVIIMEALRLKISREMFEMWKSANSNGFEPY